MIITAMVCRLVGFVVHSGSTTSGYYVTYMRRNRQWRLYDDSVVSQFILQAAEQTAEQAYL
jgi:ubiquitin C-terminal hydrolase